MADELLKLANFGARRVLPGLQAAGDIFGDPEAENLLQISEQDEVLLQPDPKISALSEANVDPRVVKQLRDQDKERIRVERLNQAVRKEEDKLQPVDEDRSLIARIGGVPVGFQVGTALGIENPTMRFLADLILDPLNFISGIGVLTKAGRAAKFLTRAGKTMSAETKARSVTKGLEMLSRSLIDEKFADELAGSIISGNKKNFRKLAKESGKRKFTNAEIVKIGNVDKDLVPLLTGDKNFMKGLEASFDLFGKEVDRFDELSKLNQLRQGHRSLIRFGIPFTSLEFGHLKFGAGAKALQDLKFSADEAIKAIGETVKGEKTSILRGQLDDVTEGAIHTFMQEKRAQANKIFSDIPDDLVTNGLNGGGAATGRQVRNFNKVVAGIRNGVRIVSNEIGAALSVMRRSSPTVGKVIARYMETLDPAELAKLNPQQQLIMKEVQGLTDDVAGAATDIGLFQDGYENFVAHIVRFSGTEGQASINEFSRKLARSNLARGRVSKLPKNRHALPRFFDDFNALKKWIRAHPEKGLSLVSDDITEIFPRYLDSIGQAIVRNRQIQTLSSTRMLDGLPVAINGLRLQKIGRGRSREAILAGRTYFEPKNLVFNNAVDDNRRWHFRKDMWPWIDPMLTRNSIQDMARQNVTGVSHILQAADNFNSLAKATLFNLNPFFHAAALTYSNLALLPFGKAVPASYEALRDGVKLTAARMGGEAKFADAVTDLFLKQRSRNISLPGTSLVSADDVNRSMLTSGLQLGRATLDAHSFGVLEEKIRAMQGVLEGQGAVAKGLSTGAEGVRKFNDWGDKFLWNIIQDQYKITAWQHIMQSETLKWMRKHPGRVFEGIDLQKTASEVSSIVNQAYGGLLYEKLAASPAGQQMFRWLLLAPDWTISNMLMARDLFVNMPGLRGMAQEGRGIFRDVMLPDVRFRWAAQYNLRAAGYGALAANVLNWVFTKYKTGEGKFLWENDNESFDPSTGAKSRVELPFDRPDGRRLFMDIWKQFAEPLRAVREPERFVTSKMGVLPRVFRTAILGQDAFGNEIAGTDEGPYADITQRIFVLTGQFMPISAQSAIEGIGSFAKVDPGAGPSDQRGLPAALISSALGMSIRSESKKGFEAREKISAFSQAKFTGESLSDVRDRLREQREAAGR